jgi:hydroxymethylpyrimidine/phosphomethylpyrimidine kinase
VSDFLEMLREEDTRVPVVLDPVLRSSSGRELLAADGVAVMRKRLLPLVDWVTPNLEELGVLTGQVVGRREEMLDAARVLQVLGEELNVVATGGHLDPPDDLVLVGGEEAVWLSGERIASQSTHGTGCAYSSALLSRIVLGDGSKEAAVMAKRYVTEAIRTAAAIGHGVGPMNLLWPLQDD